MLQHWRKLIWYNPDRVGKPGNLESLAILDHTQSATLRLCDSCLAISRAVTCPIQIQHLSLKYVWPELASTSWLSYFKQSKSATMLNILLTKAYWAAKLPTKQMAGEWGSGLKMQELVTASNQRRNWICDRSSFD